MDFKRFSLLLALRLTLILLTLSVASWLLLQPGYQATLTLVLLLAGLQCWRLVSYVARTNTELARFLGAARYADFNQQFTLQSEGAGFDTLGSTFSDILNRMQAQRTEQEQDLRHLRALLEHVPVPLISIAGNGDITQWNNAARRLFGSQPLVNTGQLRHFGDSFAKELLNLNAGERRLMRFSADDSAHQLIVTCAQIIVSGYTEKLISLQDIQSELEGAQLQAWQDLVRVLTHEILNSITPVSSLAQTASSLAHELKPDQSPAQQQDIVADLQQAVDTLARRAENLLSFVSSYRQMTRLPPPDKQPLLIRELLDHIARLMQQELLDAGVTLSVNIEPASLALQADRHMVEQVLINLLRNAGHALRGRHNARLTINASLSRRGRPLLQVADNGPGIAEHLLDKIFVPFFTTKPEGSGVGLALSRQIMLAHGGTLTHTDTPGGGATFNLNF